MKRYSKVIILTALIAGFVHISHQTVQFLIAISDGSFAITLYYNRMGEAWADAICFAGFLILAIAGLILYVSDIKKE